MFADVTSANVVGYMNKTARTGFNYVTPIFRVVGGTTTDCSVQDIQMDANAGSLSKNFQRLNFAGGVQNKYFWITAADSVKADYSNIGCPAGKNGVWAIQTTTGSGRSAVTTYSLPTGEEAVIKEGDSILINAAEGDQIMFAGEVAKAGFAVTARTGFNYIGNAYPIAMSIQNVQMDANAGSLSKNFQRLNFAGGVQNKYFWITAADSVKADYSNIGCPAGKNGVWAIQTTTGSGRSAVTTYSLPTGEEALIQPGDGVLINAAEGDTITVESPISAL